MYLESVIKTLHFFPLNLTTNCYKYICVKCSPYQIFCMYVYRSRPVANASISFIPAIVEPIDLDGAR